MSMMIYMILIIQIFYEWLLLINSVGASLQILLVYYPGRNFETRTYEEDIARESFEKLSKGIIDFINENNFKKFIMIIKSAGFITSHMIRSKNALNFAYILYLTLRSNGYNPAEIESYVRNGLYCPY